MGQEAGVIVITAVKLIRRYKWSQVALLYDDNFALKSLQPVLDLTATSGPGFMIVTRQLTLHKREGYRSIEHRSLLLI